MRPSTTWSPSTADPLRTWPGGGALDALPRRGARQDGGFRVDRRERRRAGEARCARVVNAAGLFAGAVAAGDPRARRPWARPVFYCKGTYFGSRPGCPSATSSTRARARRARGAPHPRSGRAGRFGPDTEWVAARLRLDAGRGGLLRGDPRLLAGTSRRRLAPDYTGISSNCPRRRPATDFAIEGEAAHGMAGLVNLSG